MKVYGQLENAQVENKTSDYSSGVTGRTWFRTDIFKTQLDDGTNIRALLRNDGYCVLGNHASAANNTRLHRGASGVTQLVAGNDVTAEGTLSTSLNQISARLENYTNSGKPAAGNAGRIIWVTDLGTGTPMIDTGSYWKPVIGGLIGNINWVESDLAPLAGVNNNVRTYQFQATLGQSLYAAVKIPFSYAGGSQIFLKTMFYSADSSGTSLIQTITTLIRAGTDLITSTTNQRTSTNAAVTLSGATTNIPQVVSADLTSTTGTINSVAVSAGDILIINLKRNTLDTATSDVYVPVNSCEVTF